MNTNHTHTHTQQLKANFSSNKKQILWLTKMNDEQYENFKLDTGRAFIELHYKTEDVEQLCSSKAFWSWWQYNWNTIDDTLILEQIYATVASSRAYMYRALHQYVFDNNDDAQELLMKDFLSVRNSFLPKQIK